MKTYTVFSPDEVRFPLGVIDKKGNVLSGIRALDVIIANAKKGLANNKANNLLCARNIEQSEGKDVITLGKLMGRPSKPKDRNFVCEVLKRQSCCLFEDTGDGNKASRVARRPRRRRRHSRVPQRGSRGGTRCRPTGIPR